MIYSDIFGIPFIHLVLSKSKVNKVINQLSKLVVFRTRAHKVGFDPRDLEFNWLVLPTLVVRLLPLTLSIMYLECIWKNLCGYWTEIMQNKIFLATTVGKLIDHFIHMTRLRWWTERLREIPIHLLMLVLLDGRGGIIQRHTCHKVKMGFRRFMAVYDACSRMTKISNQNS